MQIYTFTFLLFEPQIQKSRANELSPMPQMPIETYVIGHAPFFGFPKSTFLRHSGSAPSSPLSKSRLAFLQLHHMFSSMLWFGKPAFPEEPNELETCHPASPRVQTLDLLLLILLLILSIRPRRHGAGSARSQRNHCYPIGFAS